MGTRVYIEVPEVQEATGRGRSPFFRNSQSKVEVIIFTYTLALRLVHRDNGEKDRLSGNFSSTSFYKNYRIISTIIILLKSTNLHIDYFNYFLKIKSFDHHACVVHSVPIGSHNAYKYFNTKSTIFYCLPNIAVKLLHNKHC